MSLATPTLATRLGYILTGEDRFPMAEDPERGTAGVEVCGLVIVSANPAVLRRLAAGLYEAAWRLDVAQNPAPKHLVPDTPGAHTAAPAEARP